MTSRLLFEDYSRLALFYSSRPKSVYERVSGVPNLMSVIVSVYQFASKYRDSRVLGTQCPAFRCAVTLDNVVSKDWVIREIRSYPAYRGTSVVFLANTTGLIGFEEVSRLITIASCRDTSVPYHMDRLCAHSLAQQVARERATRYALLVWLCRWWNEPRTRKASLLSSLTNLIALASVLRLARSVFI